MELAEMNLDYDEEFRSRAALVALGMFRVDGEVIARLQHGEPPQHLLVAKFCYGVADAMAAERRKRMRGDRGDAKA